MNSISMSSYRPYQKLHPLSLLAQLISRQATGCLKVVNGSMSWFIYLERGKFLYASTAMDPFERLDRHLRRLSLQIPSLVSAVRVQIRLLFDKPLEFQADQTQDYQAICWLVEQEHLSIAQATVLIEELAKDVLESFLSLQEGSYELIEDSPMLELPRLCLLDLRPLVEACQHQLRQRQSNRNVTSLLDRSRSSVGTTQNGTHSAETAQRPSVNSSNNSIASPSTPPSRSAPVVPKTTYTIACIDDSPTVLNAINTYLDDKSFNVVMIDNPVKALMQVIRSKPDLILLDVTMPSLDGYELCSLLRKHSSFKHTPIIMVTGKTGFIDRAKAKLVGASGYLTKPFSQSDLIKVVFQHLR
jgi:two-component system, chemotaxis family, response regulator PixG